MGNKHGTEKKKTQRSKEEKRKEKEFRKEQKKKDKEKKNKKKHAGKRENGDQTSGLDTDWENSSHVTGGDSESGVFHSAENLSVSPYLDSCTRSDLEHSGPSWTGTLDSTGLPIFTSRGLHDGFSLEALLPPELNTRPISSYESSCQDSNYSSNKSVHKNITHSDKNDGDNRGYFDKRGLSIVKSNPVSMKIRADDNMSISTSSQTSTGGGNTGTGYHTPLLSTPIFPRADKLSHLSSTLTRKCDKSDMNDQNQTLYNVETHPHHKTPPKSVDFHNLHKPTSPHPQRRALSPKMTSQACKILSSDDSSSSPTTPTPQRKRTGNLFSDFFRSSIKKDEKKRTNLQENDDSKIQNSKSPQSTIENKTDLKINEEDCVNKTERNTKSSIFGIIKINKQKSDTKLTEIMDCLSQPIDMQNQKLNNSEKNKIHVSVKQPSLSVESSNLIESQEPLVISDILNEHISSLAEDNKSTDRNSSPPTAKSTAFCIMRLEELERSIEKTIREKFPDAEPFLLKRRSPEETSRGSQSLPTTPSLKKKRFQNQNITQQSADVQDDTASSGQLDNTRYCQESYESPPSPQMSPVIHRRFGPRARHASISPKIPRAKTAAIFNSPFEMAHNEKLAGIQETLPTKTITKIPNYCAVSVNQPNTPVLTRKHLTNTQKPQSSQNSSTASINSESEQRRIYLTRQENIEECADSDNYFEENLAAFEEDFDDQIILPTLSALFGSVSPKLKRHLEAKFEDIKNEKSGKRSRCQEFEYSRSHSLDSGTKTNIIYDSDNKNKDEKHISVKARVKSINKSMSEGWKVSPINSAQNSPNLRQSGEHNQETDNATVKNKRAGVNNNSSESGVSEVREKVGMLTSPNSARKQSAEHVVFGTAVALPCRVYSRIVSAPENVSRSHSSHVHNTSEENYQHEERRNSDYEDCSLFNDNVFNTDDNSKTGKIVESSKQVGILDVSEDFPDIFNNTKSQRTCKEHNEYRQQPHSFGTNKESDELNRDAFEHKHPLSEIISSMINKEKRLSREYSEYHELPHPIIDNYENDLTFTMSSNDRKTMDRLETGIDVNKEVNTFKPTLASRVLQSSPSPFEHDLLRLEPATATMKPIVLHQSCSVLEEKVIYSDSSSVSLPSSPVNLKKSDDKIENIEEFATKLNEAQKEVYEEPIHPMKFQRETRIPVIPTDFYQSIATSKSENINPFSKIKNEDASNTCHKIQQKTKPPPPSPTAMELLMEEFDEEDDTDYDDCEKVDLLSLKRDTEFLEFSRKVSNRLSDLIVDDSGDSESEELSDDNVFDGSTSLIQNVDELISRIESDKLTTSNYEEKLDLTETEVEKKTAQIQPQVEDLSSSTTSSSSSSDLFRPPISLPQQLMSSETESKQNIDNTEIDFPKPDTGEFHPAFRRSLSRDSRDCQSDDDIARGQGIPDYYDDRPLWTRKQKPPNQLSFDMAAIRRRERRERWLKKRRRNKTDFVSGNIVKTKKCVCSNDSKYPVRTGSFDSNCDVSEEDSYENKRDLGSGILNSPKYAKPILPYFEKGIEKQKNKASSGELESEMLLSSEIMNVSETCDLNNEAAKENVAIPGIEDTFAELLSVKHILEDLQERGPSSASVLPLTSENVKSMRDYYKDYYSNGRRSRMSLTDKTESDIDFSEHQDDASSDSNLYADDEGDDDAGDNYTTAEDLESDENDETDDIIDDKPFVISCTFYNSKTLAATDSSSTGISTTSAMPLNSENTQTFTETGSKVISIPGLVNTTSFATVSSTGAATDGSSSQTPCASARSSIHTVSSENVSNTFQNAREQMIDIQHHLQALRRQMEGMQDDVSNPSTKPNPNKSFES